MKASVHRNHRLPNMYMVKMVSVVVPMRVVARRAEDTLQEQMIIGVHSVEDDGNVWKELGDDVESTCSIILLVVLCKEPQDKKHR